MEVRIMLKEGIAKGGNLSNTGNPKVSFED